MKHQAVLFDLDGTLLDTLDDLANSMNSVLQCHGFPRHPRAAFRYLVGTGIENLVRLALPESHRDNHTVDLLVSEQRAEYGRRWKELTQPYDGVPEMLDLLTARHIKMAVFSNKPDDFTKLCVNEWLSKWAFHAVIGARPGLPRKPDPSGALEAARLMGVSPPQCLYLGDTNTDMETAVRAQMHPVGALWGFRDAAELSAAGAEKLIARPVDILGLLDD